MTMWDKHSLAVRTQSWARHQESCPFMLYMQILRRQNVRYDDQRGPVLLVFLLACALVASTVITAKSAFGGF